MGLLALGLTLAVLGLAAFVAPTLSDLATPAATRVDTATSGAPPAPTWAKHPMAPPSVLRAR
jgi:hypothetical protein